MSKIFFNKKVCNYFDVPFDNAGTETVVHTEALSRVEDLYLTSWEDPIIDLIDLGLELELVGIGNGWWEIKNN